MVTLMVLCGRPLMVEPRGPPVVFVPGRRRRKYMVLRLCSGRLEIWLTFSVVEMLADCVCTISPSPCTTTDSLVAHTSSATFTVAGTPASSLTSFTTPCLKPAAETVTRYVPEPSEGTV